jgi:ferric-dicitrate binding protein FerR (iron transport regulator)
MTNPGTPFSADIESSDIERDPAHLAAAEWLVRLQGTEVSLEDTLTWQGWLNESPGNARAFARIEAVSQAVRSVPVPRAVSADRLAADRYDASIP